MYIIYFYVENYNGKQDLSSCVVHLLVNDCNSKANKMQTTAGKENLRTFQGPQLFFVKFKDFRGLKYWKLKFMDFHGF